MVVRFAVCVFACPESPKREQTQLESRRSRGGVFAEALKSHASKIQQTFAGNGLRRQWCPRMSINTHSNYLYYMWMEGPVTVRQPYGEVKEK